MLRAILLDFDGVIADTEPLHFRGFQKILAEEGIRLTKKAYYDRYLGYDDHDCFKAVYRDERQKIGETKLHRLTRRKTRYMKELLGRRRVLLPGARRTIQMLARRYPLAIVSGALRGEIKLILKKEDLTPFISILVTAEDVVRGKPHPEGFLRALRLFNQKVYDPKWPIRAKECLVVEDSFWGIQAAHRAGMHCLAVSTSYPRAKLQEADLVWTGLKAIDRSSLPQLERLCAPTSKPIKP